MIQPATKKDAPHIAKLAVQMWDSVALSELKTEIAETIGCENAVLFVFGRAFEGKYEDNCNRGCNSGWKNNRCQ